MKKIAIALVGLVAAAPAGAFADSKAECPKGTKRAEVLWTRNICVQPGRYIGWPTVCRLKSGDILAVFSGDREGHCCPSGKVQMVRSADGGETWSKARTIADIGIVDDRDAGIVQLPSGEIIVSWFTSIVFGTDAGLVRRHPDWKRYLDGRDPAAVRAAKGYFLIRSRDDGRTWSRPERLNCDHAPHGPVVLRDGSLLQVGRDQERTDCSKTICQISAMRSTDAGCTWTTLCERIAWAKGDNTRPDLAHEPHVAELPDGTLVAMVRYEGDAGLKYLRQSVSKDGGRTWSTLAKVPLAGFPPHLLALPDGKLVCVYGCRQRQFGEYACISDDGGKTWDVANEILLSPSHSSDLGYPASTLLADGTILTVYYQQPAPGRKPCLMATKWRIIR